MDLKLKDKVVVVTGGAQGIGAATVEACCAEGAIAVIVSRQSQAGKELQSKLGNAGKVCELIEVELAAPENCQLAVQRTLQKFGRIDALVNNAGINDKVGLEEGSPERFVESLRNNLLHYYCMAHYALVPLKAARGSIVNIGSKTALTGQGGTSGYTAAKGAILALTREWAAELLPHEVRVNAVIPAEVMTPLYRDWLASFPNPEEKWKSILSKIPLGRRMTRADEIAAMVMFLLSAQAGHITGQHMVVDGGYTHLDRALT
ncbi:MAG: SDR family oxidoreductase [Candidatus Sulfotelmatobacter sp.]|jgi:NAD(P)-dependent dehydrogenase (short-subunit alcohol dehydrogenase family)